MTEPPSGSSPADPAGEDELDADERAELLRLREEVAAAQAAGATSAGRGRRRIPSWRAVVATVLIALACVLAPLSVIAVWARNQVGNTDRYVANVAPLVSTPSVQAALTDRITTEIFNHIDIGDLVNEAVDALAAQGLPERAATALRGLSGTIESGARSFVHDQVEQIVMSDAFQRAWIAANRVAHQQLVALLEGKTDGVVTVSGDAVTVDLAAFIEVAKQGLIDAGFSIANQIPEIHPQFTIIQSRDLPRLQRGFSWLDTLATALPFIVLGLLAIGVYVARNHRRALIWAGLGLTISMVVLAAALAFGRSTYLDRLPETASAPAAAATFDTLVRFVKAGLRSVAVLGLVVAAGAFVSGPSTTAVRIRAGSSAAIGRLRRLGESAGLRTGPVGQWVYRNRSLLRGGIIAAACLTLVFWDRPTGKVVLLLAVLALLALAIVEFLARPPEKPAPA